jgi:hypothetical protein
MIRPSSGQPWGRPGVGRPKGVFGVLVIIISNIIFEYCPPDPGLTDRHEIPTAAQTLNGTVMVHRDDHCRDDPANENSDEELTNSVRTNVEGSLSVAVPSRREIEDDSVSER